MFAYCLNNPVSYCDPRGTAAVIDDIILIAGAIVLVSIGIFFLATTGVLMLQSDDPHHILHGTNKKHEDEWKRFGIDPNDPDGNNWGKLLPILEETYRNGKELTSKIVNEAGDKITYFVKEFEEYRASVILKIWESAESGLQKISDAWANLF